VWRRGHERMTARRVHLRRRRAGALPAHRRGFSVLRAFWQTVGAGDLDEDAFAEGARGICDLYGSSPTGAGLDHAVSSIRIFWGGEHIGRHRPVLVEVPEALVVAPLSTGRPEGCEQAAVAVPAGFCGLRGPCSVQLGQYLDTCVAGVGEGAPARSTPQSRTSWGGEGNVSDVQSSFEPACGTHRSRWRLAASLAFRGHCRPGASWPRATPLRTVRTVCRPPAVIATGSLIRRPTIRRRWIRLSVAEVLRRVSAARGFPKGATPLCFQQPSRATRRY